MPRSTCFWERGFGSVSMDDPDRGRRRRPADALQTTRKQGGDLSGRMTALGQTEKHTRRRDTAGQPSITEMPGDGPMQPVSAINPR